jgi:hypothetical protein
MWRLTRQERQVLLAVVALLLVGMIVKACRRHPIPPVTGLALDRPEPPLKGYANRFNVTDVDPEAI